MGTFSDLAGFQTVPVIFCYYNDVIMSSMASQITSLTIVYSTVYSGADQKTYLSSVSLLFVRRIHRWPLNSPHKGPITRKMFPINDVIMARRENVFKENKIRIVASRAVIYSKSLNLSLIYWCRFKSNLNHKNRPLLNKNCISQACNFRLIHFKGI